MKFRRQSRDSDGMNLTPLIDVVFVLLIFFMVSTTFNKETHLTVELPQATSEPNSDVAGQLEILVNSEGNYFVNGQALVSNNIETLKTALQKTSEGNTKLPLIVTADAKTPHQAVVRAMDAAGQLGFVHLSITTQQPVAEKAE